MTRAILTCTLLSLLSATACGGGENAGGKAGDKADKGGAAGPAAPLDPRVAKAVEVADAINKAPGEADAVLAKHGLDRDKLDALMFEIAKDPALSDAYRAARAD